jgi:DNA (cytosine-5)-methyltransferase 1
MSAVKLADDIHNEIVVDLFAGGGGASTGIEQAIGRAVDVAINHDAEAISLHTANHPQTQHFCSDVFEVDPVAATGGRPVGLLWASPDCKHFSKAKGGKPVSKKIRSLAWVVVKWAKAVRPRMIFLENVEEFQTWGPLTADNLPCPLRKGDTFRLWKRSLEKLGYVVEHRELRACDYGTPTIRKRLFLVARRDGQPIVWPEPTHGAPGSLAVKAKKLKPWRTAAECIDWSIPAPSIFERKKPLAEATCRRIAKGIMRYVVEAKEPFIVGVGGRAGQSPERGLSKPVGTITSKGDAALCVPTLIQVGYGEREGQAPRALDINKPIGTLVGSQKHALVSAFLAKHYTGVVGSDLADPLGTITCSDHHSLVTANLIHMGHGEGKDGGKRFSHGIRDVDQPLNTITASGAAAAIVTSNLVKLRGDNVGSATDEPLHTISAQGTHHAEVRAFLVAYYGVDQDPAMREPMHTVTTKDRFGLVTIHGTEYAIVDIGLRMLTPRELYTAQGFPASYQIDHGADGVPLTKTAQVRMCGNSVCPPLSRAIAMANYADQITERMVA